MSRRYSWQPSAARQPGHDRLLSGHPQAASRLPASAPASRPADWISLTWTPADRRLPDPHLESSRGNSITTRNNRLAAIRSLFGYAALPTPEHAALIARVQVILAKRHDHVIVSFLTRPRSRRCWQPPTPRPGDGSPGTSRDLAPRRCHAPGIR